MNVKVSQTTNIVKEELLLQGIDYIENDNILYGNICKDGLHINQGGAKKFARNVKKYLEYWQGIGRGQKKLWKIQKKFKLNQKEVCV